jgi:hypothetical protein
MKPHASLLLGATLATALLAPAATSPLSLAAVAPAALKKPTAPLSNQTLARIKQMTALFDGKTLESWVQVPVNRVVEILRFKDRAAGKKGPIAWQEQQRVGPVR